MAGELPAPKAAETLGIRFTKIDAEAGAIEVEDEEVVEAKYGIDIDPDRIREANENARRNGVTDLVKFRQEDLFKADFREATVVTLYLLPDLNVKLRPKLWAELKPGTRIVSHQFEMGNWKPEKTVEVNGRTIYFWTVPQKKQ